MYDIVRVKKDRLGMIGAIAGRTAVVVGISERRDPSYYMLKIDGYGHMLACEYTPKSRHRPPRRSRDI